MDINNLDVGGPTIDSSGKEGMLIMTRMQTRIKPMGALSCHPLYHAPRYLEWVGLRSNAHNPSMYFEIHNHIIYNICPRLGGSYN
jgi:hypothetical protein